MPLLDELIRDRFPAIVRACAGLTERSRYVYLIRINAQRAIIDEWRRVLTKEMKSGQ